MRPNAAAITLISATTMLVGACGVGGGNPAQAPSATVTSVARVAIAAPPAGHAAAGRPAPPPDAEGNPACPTVDSWGASGGHTGIAVSYWAHGADYVTVLVRTTGGPDVARSVTVEPGQALQLFEFPDTSPAAVKEVLIMTNDMRCYATADPAMSGR